MQRQSTSVGGTSNAEQALRESEALFRNMVDHAPVMAWVTEADGTCSFLSKSWYAFTGHTPEERDLNQAWAQCLHPDDRDRAHAGFLAANADQEAFRMEYRLRRHDGHYRWAIDAATPRFAADGRYLGYVGSVIDITERKEAEERLQEEVRISETISQVSGALAVELDLTNMVQAVTDGATKLTGAQFGAFFYNAIDQQGESYMLYTLSGVPRAAFAAFPMPRNTAVFERTFRGQGILRLDDVTLDARYGKNPPYHGMPQGHLPVKSYLAVPVVLGSGEVLGGLFFGHSEVGVFTERHEQLIVGLAAQAAIAIDNTRLYDRLRESAQRLSLALSASNLGDWSWNANTDLVSFSERAAEIFGIPVTPSITWTAMRNMLHQEDRERVRQAVEHSVAQRERYNVEYRIERPDASLVWVSARGSAHYDTAGNPLGMLGVVQDITEAKRREEALRTSERLYRAIGESIDYGVWVCDAAGRNVYASESFLRLVGLTQEQCSNFGWGEVLHPDDSAHTIAAWQECVRTGSSWDREHRFRGVDGAWHPILARGVPVRNEQGELNGWAGINLDIGRLKQVEDELRVTDRRKDEFLATLAHELRNPLAPLRNALAILQRADASDAQKEQARAIMARQTAQMVRLVDELLDISRIRTGKIELRREPVELRSIVDDALEIARPIIEQRRHQISVSAPEVPVHIEADRTRMAQVLSNLLNNAAKYTEQGGHLWLQAEHENGALAIRVRDTGVGIAPQSLSQIFEMFTQADHSFEHAQGGLGVGLTLARRLVELHGGSLEAHSDGPGRGSEFVVRLPLPQAPLSPVPMVQAPRQPSPRHGRCVLVADDNVDYAASLAAMLRLEGHEVHVAHDGAEAIDVAAAVHPEVALLDIGMPRLDGCEVAQRLRATGGQLTLIAISGWGQHSDRERSRKAGFDHHLVKPVDAVEVCRLVTLAPGAAAEAPGSFDSLDPPDPLAKPSAAAPASATAPHGRKVLVVDDSSAVQESIASMLGSAGYEVRTASDGAEALTIVEQFAPQFVLLDIHMPQMNGFEVAHRLRARFAAAEMKLILMSGDALYDALVRHARQAGFDACVDKMADPETWLQQLN